MAERITIEKIKALEAEYEVTIPEEIKNSRFPHNFEWKNITQP